MELNWNELKRANLHVNKWEKEILCARCAAAGEWDISRKWMNVMCLVVKQLPEKMCRFRFFLFATARRLIGPATNAICGRRAQLRRGQSSTRFVFSPVPYECGHCVSRRRKKLPPSPQIYFETKLREWWSDLLSSGKSFNEFSGEIFVFQTFCHCRRIPPHLTASRLHLQFQVAEFFLKNSCVILIPANLIG